MNHTEENMPAERIDFKYVREHADFEKVLAAYGVKLTKDGSKPGQWKALCPFHDDHKPSMKVNTERKIYNCFACDASGNVLDFVAQMDDLELRPAAKKVAELSGCATSAGTQHKRRTSKADPKGRGASKPETAAQPAAKADKDTPEHAFNPPLNFELKNLRTEHPFFTERCITPEMIEAFGLGIATRGIMKGRLVFPIRNKDGQLVAYAGRWVDGELPEDTPKYKLPTGFRKELELFGYKEAQAAGPDCTLVLVESFLSVVKMADRYMTASPMGRSLSPEQMTLLGALEPKQVVLLFDGDDPGRTAVETVGADLLKHGFTVTAPSVPTDFKPHRCTLDQLDKVLEHHL